MMNKDNNAVDETKLSLYERIFYNNKFLLVLSFVIAIVLWAVVKVNYSETKTRNISDVKVTLDASFAAENNYMPFYEDDDLTVDIEVAGKAYDISAYSLTRDDIVIEANSGYIDAPGYKTLTLSPRITEAGVSVVRVNPSTITVFFDRAGNAEVNVEARLTNDISTLSSEGFNIGQIVPSVSTARVSGPASLVEQLTKVYFEATVPDDQLPLSATTELNAEISFGLDAQRDARFLACDNVGTNVNPATVTIPVYRVGRVPTAVKFVNQPAYFDENPPKVSISPAEVEISYTAEEEPYTSFNIGTVDFHTLKNGVNKLNLTVDDRNASLLIDSAQKEFSVTVDFSGMRRKTIDATASDVVFLNQQSNYKYTVRPDSDALNELTVIGPQESLDKITAENLQIEINVSSLRNDTGAWQRARVSNISLHAEDVTDCWVFGNYTVPVRVTEK